MHRRYLLLPALYPPVALAFLKPTPKALICASQYGHPALRDERVCVHNQYKATKVRGYLADHYVH
jgi:hypothetical protein